MSGIGDFIIGLSAIGGSGTSTLTVMLAVFRALSTQNPDDDSWPTVAQGRVYMPRDWPVTDEEVPILKIQMPTETKEALGNAGIKFLTTARIKVFGEVSAKAEANDAAANKILMALGLFARQIELAVIGDPALFGGDARGLIQQLISVQTSMAVTTEGKLHRGGLEMEFAFTFYQGEADFQQQPLTDLEVLHLFADLINVADPTGTYTPPPELDYTPVPAPRTHGPDGRIEGEAEIDLPQ